MLLPLSGLWLIFSCMAKLHIAGRVGAKAALIALCLLLVGRSAEAGVSTYTIIAGNSVPLEKVSVTYYLGGSSGGFRMSGQDLRSKDGKGFVIPCAKADMLEAVLYCPGYQFVRVYEPKLAKSTAATTVIFKKLRQIDFHGKVEAPAGVLTKDSSVEIRYMGGPGMAHANIIDGFVTDYIVARVPVAPDGSFSASVPDFYQDPLTLSAEGAANALEFFVVGGDGGRRELTPKANTGGGWGLKIGKSYESPVVFSVRKY